MKERNCPDEWCARSDALKWPDVKGSYDQFLTPGHKQYTLNIQIHKEL
jgi:hypothetical protein